MTCFIFDSFCIFNDIPPESKLYNYIFLLFFFNLKRAIKITLRPMKLWYITTLIHFCFATVIHIFLLLEDRGSSTFASRRQFVNNGKRDNSEESSPGQGRTLLFAYVCVSFARNRAVNGCTHVWKCLTPFLLHCPIQGA